ncbi:MAG: peptide chain release factor N(5)-glutamine methyltransferase [Clostridiales bacterium]|jgi:release factor-specific protein-(glutamine-N5) methyltransferase|nr:peptide chain release factor N(5)-glutamine methyltransferase [Clostridiales bacterium]
MREKTDKQEKPVRRTMIGGQALMEGVMMRGRAAMAMAVRTDEGEILTETKRLAPGKWYRRVPVLRGCISFVDSLINGTRSLLKSAEVAFPEEETPGKGWFAFSAALGVLLAVGVFIALPSLLASILDNFVFYRYVFTQGEHIAVLVSALIEGVIRIALFVLYLFLVSKMKDIRRTFMYHGAEHRTINCYEKGLPLTVENVQSCSTRHNRCGTTFLFFVMIVSILIFALTNWLFRLWDFDFSGFLGGLTRLGIRLALLPLVAGLSYELLRFLALLPDNRFTNILRAPGLALQRLTTYPPEDDMAAVAIESFSLVLEMDENPAVAERHFGEVSVDGIRRVVKKILLDAGVEEASETEWVIAAGLKKKRSAFSTVESLTLAQYKRVVALANKRAAGVPLDYITGFTEFYGYKLKVDEKALLPRMETETLCETAIGLIGETAPTVLDLMTGSGCIAYVLAKKTAAKVTASDVSEEALSLARKNFADTGIEAVQSDLFSGLADRTFDYILSNPPYITDEEMKGLAKEVLCQPEIALKGGPDGLDFYRRIALEAPAHLNPGGRLLLEIGHTQYEGVRALLEPGFTDVACVKDLSGSDRVVTARLR